MLITQTIPRHARYRRLCNIVTCIKSNMVHTTHAAVGVARNLMRLFTWRSQYPTQQQPPFKDELPVLGINYL